MKELACALIVVAAVFAVWVSVALDQIVKSLGRIEKKLDEQQRSE